MHMLYCNISGLQLVELKHLKKDSQVASFLILHIRCYTEIHLCFCKDDVLAQDCNIQLSPCGLSGKK